MECVFPARNGLTTVSRNGLRLHSSFDPKKEAHRFVETLDLGLDPPVIILMGACLGYTEDALADRFPNSEILCVSYSGFFRTHHSSRTPEKRWYPDAPEKLTSFLSRNISDDVFSRLRVVTWEPAGQAYPDEYRDLSHELIQFTREISGSITTTRYFGRRWVRNAVKNFLSRAHSGNIDPISAPIVIAASGPSLETLLPILRKHRRGFSLWALPSSLSALLSYEIWPDLVILTDPGYYSALHFSDYFRGGKKKRSSTILMPLTGYPVFHNDSSPVVFFNQGTVIEKSLLSFITPVPEEFHPNGTVAGSAIEAAMRKTDSTVFIAGLDLASRGLFEHTRPHGFDPYIISNTKRTDSEESRRFSRIVDAFPYRLDPPWRTSPSLRTYGGWFARRKSLFSNRVFRIGPSPVETGMPSVSPAELTNLPEVSPALSLSAPQGAGLSPRIRGRIIIDILEKTIRGFSGNSETPAAGIELSALVDPVNTAEYRKDGDSGHLLQAREFFQDLIASVGAAL